MTDVALIREDTRRAIVIEGAVLLDTTHDGALTDDPMPDRTYVTHGAYIRPVRMQLQAVVSPRPGSPGLLSGDARLQEVSAFLAAVHARVPAAVQRPGLPQVPSMVIETYSVSETGDEGFSVQMSLKQVRYVSTRSVSVAPDADLVRGDVKAALQDPVDKGTGVAKPEDDRSTLAAGWDALAGGE